MFTYAYFHPRRNLAKTGRGGGVGGGGCEIGLGIEKFN